MNVTQRQKDAAYHCGIGDLLQAAYQREFSMLECGKYKTEFRRFNEWYATLDDEQRGRVDALLQEEAERTATPRPK